MNRFQVWDPDKARTCANADEFMLNNAWMRTDTSSFLVDTMSNEIIFTDHSDNVRQGRLGVELKPLVDLLNELALERNALGALAMIHRPQRGDDVDEWVKRNRDFYRATNVNVDGYTVLDNLLNDYRLHADTGMPLSEEARDGTD